jgi:multiple sugar transport system permease protein
MPAPARLTQRPKFQPGHFILLILVLVFCVFPFYWMVATSLKERSAALAYEPVFFFQPTLANYSSALGRADIVGAMINSLIIALSTTAVSLLLGLPAAYALARFEFKGKQDLWFWFISNRMISPIVLALPFFLLARQLKLLDTHIGLVLIYLTFNIPIVVWICADQFRNIPKELDEAAMLEGYGPWKTFIRIAVPLAAPGIAVSAIFSFIFSWNELLYALILTRTAAKTAPVVATGYLGGYELPWGEIMAAATLIVLPVLVFSIIVSRQLVSGLTMGAVK